MIRRQFPASGDRLTAAQKRVLLKAQAAGYIMASGGFGGGRSDDPIRDPRFDRSRHINNLVDGGLLIWGDYCNVYHLTEAGERSLQRLKVTRLAAKRKARAAGAEARPCS